MTASRRDVVSSFTIIKGAMIDETWTALTGWDLDADLDTNLARICAANPFGANANWLRDIRFVLHRRIDPRRDRALIVLARSGCDRAAWIPTLLWHITRDEYLLREFLTGWLFARYEEGAVRLDTAEVVAWLQQVERRRDLKWTDNTRNRVAAGLLRVAVDFGLLADTVTRRFTSYHLPDGAFLYLLHAIAEAEPNARRLIDAPDWRLFRLAPADVERELLRLHQFRRLHFDVAGSLAQLRLPAPSLLAFVQEQHA